MDWIIYKQQSWNVRTELTLLIPCDVVSGPSPKESLNGVWEEPLVRGAVVVAHGSREESCCCDEVVDDPLLVRAKSGRSPARMFEYVLNQKMQKMQKNSQRFASLATYWDR